MLLGNSSTKNNVIPVRTTAARLSPFGPKSDAASLEKMVVAVIQVIRDVRIQDQGEGNGRCVRCNIMKMKKELGLDIVLYGL